MEHRLIDWLFDRVRHTDDEQRQQLADLAHNIVKALSVHLFCEEFALYGSDGGLLRQAEWSNGGVVAGEMVKQHFVLKGGLYRLQQLTPNDEGFRQSVFWLHDRFKRHADAEEADVSSDADTQHRTARARRYGREMTLHTRLRKLCVSASRYWRR